MDRPPGRDGSGAEAPDGREAAVGYRVEWAHLGWVVLAAAAVAGFGFIPLMGLPGALVIEACAPVLGWDTLQAGPGLWGAAIFITWLWPLSFVPGWWVAGVVLRGRPWWVRGLAVLAILYGWGLLLCGWMMQSSGPSAGFNVTN